jgi:glutaredoxin
MGLSWLRFWRWGQKPVSLKHWQVVLFTRKGCHLCDAARAQLDKAQRRHGFALTQVDVDTDAELLAQYGTCVPVVQINGKVRFRGRINEVLFRRLIEAER